MQAYYSVVGFLSILVLLIMNYDIVFPKKDQKPTGKYYRLFVLAVLVYFISDMLWGVFNANQIAPLLYVDTIIYYLAMGAIVFLWCMYVAEYLRVGRGLYKLLFYIGIAIYVLEAVALVLNHFVHIFFWIDDAGQYVTFPGRYALFGIQVILFLVIGIQALIVTFNGKINKQKRYLAIAISSVCFLIAIAFQVMFPLLPIYSMGIIVSLVFLHVFVHEDERDDIRRRLQERNDIIENAGFGIWRIRIRKDGRNTMYANDKLKRIFGITDLSMDSEDLYRYYHSRLQEDVSEIEDDDYQSMLSGAVRSRLLKWKHPSKGIIYLRAGGTCLILENGDQVISGYCGDITEQRMNEDKMNASLEEAMKKAEAANRAKTAFLFNMSHDIRTPMNAIIGFTELMEKNADDPEKCKDYRRKIRSSSNFLLSLINNVLEMARIESGKMTLDENECDADSFISSLRSVFEEQMKQKNIEFTMNANIEHPFVLGDSVKLREIYLNLLSNAYKYTNEGGKVSVQIDELPYDKEGYTLFQVVVQDNGIGMSKEFLPKLFDEFSREKTYTDNKIEGTGLGMPIVKRFIDLMNGTIEVESELGIGTTFTVRIPHQIITEKKETTPVTKSSDYSIMMGKRILLAEDNELNSEIATELLEEYGFLVEHASDGIVCIDMLQKAAAGYYDVILMDIQMPNMDGYKATETIRSMNDPYRSIIPIVAMTANAFEEDKKKALDVGMNAHLAKPIQIDELLQTLYNILV